MQRISYRSRAELKQKLLDLGLWASFKRVRDSLKADGVSADEARERAVSIVAGEGFSVDVDVSAAIAKEDFEVSESIPVEGGTHRVTVEWVANNLAVSNVDLGSAPSSAAVAMLNWAKRTAQNETSFWGVWAKLLPTKAQLEERDAHADDGREHFTLLDELERDGYLDRSVG